jgi:hypothetical protein
MSLLLLFGQGSTSPFQSFVEGTLAPQHWVRLGEPSGTVAEDRGSMPQNATYVNTPTMDVTGAVQSAGGNDGAVTLNGTNEYLTTPWTIPAGSVRTFIWAVKRTSNSGYDPIFGSYQASLDIVYAPVSGPEQLWIFGIDGSNAMPCDCAFPLTDGNWHTQVLVIDQPGDTAELWTDGVTTGAQPSGSADLTGSTAPIALGHDLSGGEYHAGSLDEVMILDRRITAAEIAQFQAHFETGLAAEALADAPNAYYGMGSAAAGWDFSGNGAHIDYTSGTPTASASLVAGGVESGAQHLDAGDLWGTDDPAHEVGDSFTYECVVKPGLVAGPDASRRLMSSLSGSGPDLNFYWDFGEEMYILTLNKMDISEVVSSAPLVAELQTVIVACTKDGATTKLYINGDDVTGSVTNATMASSEQFLIGDFGDVPIDIDEVVVYDYALSPARVLAHATAANLTDSTPPVATLLTGPSATRISTQAGKDSTDVTFEMNEAVQAYKVKLVPASGSPHTAGTQIEAGGAKAAGEDVSITLTDDELVAAGATEGNLVVKLFGQDLAGNWSS